MVKSPRFLIQAVQAASCSSHNQHRVGCIIYDKKRVISMGHNTPQKSVRSITKKFLRWPNSIHAEVDAIIYSRYNLKGCSMLVVRLNKRNELKYARPCSHCLAYIVYVGIKKVIYSTGQKEIPFEVINL